MDAVEFEKYVDMLMSMSLSFKIGDISRGTFESNLRRAVRTMAPETCSCAKCTGVDLEECYRTDNEEKGN